MQYLKLFLIVVAQEYQNEIAPTFTYQNNPKTTEKLLGIVCLLLICFYSLPANTLLIIMDMDYFPLLDAPTHAAIGGQGKNSDILATVSPPIAAAKYGLRVGAGV